MARTGLAAVAALVLCGCAGEDVARHALGRRGYREVSLREARHDGAAVRCDTARAYGFTALDAEGKPRRGNVCCPVIGACRIADERDAARATRELNRQTREWIERVEPAAD